MDGLVFYIEIFSLKNPDLFFMYIPSKYEIPATEKDVDTYVLEYLELNVGDNLTEEYAGVPKQTTGGVHLKDSGEGVEKYLESNYKDSISLKDVPEEDLLELKSIYRQLRRLRYSVKDIKYKIVISFKNYLCAIRRDDSISCFTVKKSSRDQGKKLLVCTDLEILYENPEKMNEDILTVKRGIERLLEKNCTINSVTLQRMSEKTVLTIPGKISLKKTEYDSLLIKLNIMLKNISEQEEKKVEELKGLETSGGRMQDDIERVHNRSRLEGELEKIAETKSEIIKNIMKIKEKRETALLTVDKLMFDNNVMYDAIVNNYSKLRAFC